MARKSELKSLVKVKKGDMVITGIYLSTEVNACLNAYIDNYRHAFKAVRPLIKADFINNILYDFFVENHLWNIKKRDIRTKKAQREIRLNLNNMLEENYKGLPLIDCISSLNRCKTAVYLELNIYNYLEKYGDILINAKGGKSKLVNEIIKNYFVRHANISGEDFLDGNTNFKGKFTKESYLKYAYMPNKLFDDKAKLLKVLEPKVDGDNNIDLIGASKRED